MLGVTCAKLAVAPVHLDEGRCLQSNGKIFVHFSAEPEIGAIQDVNPPRPKAIGLAEVLGVWVDLSGQAS